MTIRVRIRLPDEIEINLVQPPPPRCRLVQAAPIIVRIRAA